MLFTPFINCAAEFKKKQFIVITRKQTLHLQELSAMYTYFEEEAWQLLSHRTIAERHRTTGNNL